MNNNSFPDNLAHACGFYPSIAHVCRRIGINRQQFNKYLAGTVRPSRHNLQKICDFFGVTESELLIEPGRFKELLALRRIPNQTDETSVIAPIYQRLSRRSASLERYCGNYFRYFYSFSHPGYVMRSFAQLRKKNEDYLWKNIERERNPNKRPATVTKYEGVALFLGERITIMEYETILNTSITQMILYPSYHTGIDYLLGLQTGGPLKRGRMPAASRVVLQYLGQSVNVRRALGECGLFGPEEIAPQISRLLENRLPEDSWVFEVEQQ
ncbi:MULTISPECIES: helix-turn-helix transcriptional regulator [Modicisalibacter]|uniref:helix-turn-helix domain-containing protein n=1 Tax=Modicisalibacter TaxID=574347 RepID=UPI001CCE4A90|nr:MULTISPECIES: helix-turn-helix transcriptional regulator [Modicisalibacter]MBZ9538898.1 helix-turn-helix transcriptional regulator [Modicisalibacter tunisiensis]MBZ9559599.1 helix-turn-helix transcriptional regulator [Modicisalibacter sp. R2A 31.J]MBZ9577051.1 helix-turn-helix transcriptional regulator [Modicisalibacter sp. MOD 31.J]